MRSDSTEQGGAAIDDQVRAAFRALSAGSPDGLWCAPGRVNLIGEHTDYNDGYVLPVAIDREVVIAAARRSDGLLRCWSTQAGAAPDIAIGDLALGAERGWWSYLHGTAWALREAGVLVSGADLAVDSTVPTGAGLSSSAALAVAAGLTLADLAGVDVPRGQLALAAQRAEHEWAGTPCGLMDQTICLEGRADHALLLDTRTMSGEQVPLRLDELGLALLVIDTGVTHSLAAGEYAQRRRDCEDAARLMGVPALRDVTLADVDDAAAALGRLQSRARHVVTENARVLEVAALLRAGRFYEVGPAFAASHASLRDDFAVSCDELDTAVGVAVGAGAVAARMTGGGFGGSAVAVVLRALVPQVGQAVSAAFAAAGHREPRVFLVAPSEGARRLR